MFWVVVSTPIMLLCALLSFRPLLRLLTARNAGLKTASDGLLPALNPTLEISGRWGIIGRYRLWTVKRLVRGILLRGTQNSCAVVVQCLGSSSPVSNDAIVRLFYHSVPRGLPRVGKLWTGLGVPLTLANGEVAGEICGANVFIYDDVLTTGPRKGVLLLSQILLAARRAMQIASSENGAELSKQQFTAECNRLKQASRTRRKSRITNNEEQFRSSLAAANRAELALLELEAQPTKNLEREYDALLALDKVRYLHLNDRFLSVFTGDIDCPDSRTKLLHRLGQFEIRIDLVELGKIRFFNQTRSITDFGGTVGAPHLYDDGTACLGTVKHILPRLLKQRDFAVAVQVAIAFLQSANTNDWGGRRVAKFPVVGTVP
jgi:hypothetical protein